MADEDKLSDGDKGADEEKLADDKDKSKVSGFLFFLFLFFALLVMLESTCEQIMLDYFDGL